MGQVLQDGSSHTYIVVRRGKKFLHVVKMSSRGLKLVPIKVDQLNKLGLKELPGYPLAKAVERFLAMGERVGITARARRSLEALRDNPQASLEC